MTKQEPYRWYGLNDGDIFCVSFDIYKTDPVSWNMIWSNPCFKVIGASRYRYRPHWTIRLFGKNMSVPKPYKKWEWGLRVMFISHKNEGGNNVL